MRRGVHMLLKINLNADGNIKSIQFSEDIIVSKDKYLSNEADYKITQEISYKDLISSLNKMVEEPVEIVFYSNEYVGIKLGANSNDIKSKDYPNISPEFEALLIEKFKETTSREKITNSLLSPLREYSAVTIKDRPVVTTDTSIELKTMPNTDERDITTYYPRSSGGLGFFSDNPNPPLAADTNENDGCCSCTIL